MADILWVKLDIVSSVVAFHGRGLSMWFFTPYGFFSATCGLHLTGPKKGQPDPEVIQIRARDKDHLNALKSVCGKLLGDIEIKETPNKDYRYRLIVRKEDWIEVVTQLIEDQQFSNFKSEAARVWGHDLYVQVLHEVWSTMYIYQSTLEGADSYVDLDDPEEHGTRDVDGLDFKTPF
jgi:hypothetical protein